MYIAIATATIADYKLGINLHIITKIRTVVTYIYFAIVAGLLSIHANTVQCIQRDNLFVCIFITLCNLIVYIFITLCMK